MGLLKKLKKLKKKSIGGKLLKKAISKDPIGSKLVGKDPVAKRALGMDGEGGSRGKGKFRDIVGAIKARRTGGGAQKTPTGPNMRHMSTGGPGQVSRNTGVVGPRKTGGPAQRALTPTKPMRTGGPGQVSPATTLSTLAGRSRRGIRR